MEKKIKRLFAVVIMAMMVFALMPIGGGASFTTSADSITASGKISESEVNLRSAPSTSSGIVTTLKKNASVTVQKEIFTTRNNASATKRWYYVTAGDKTGYVRADLVGSLSFGNTGAVTTDALNYRTGPATSFSKLGTAGQGTAMAVLLPASRDGSSEDCLCERRLYQDRRRSP